MPASKAKIKANNKYTQTHYDSIKLIVHKGDRDIIKSYAHAHGKSVNSYLLEILEREIPEIRH